MEGPTSRRGATIAFHLTRIQRQRLFADELPRISGEGKPPVAKGHTHNLSKRVWLEVIDVTVYRTQLGRPAWTLRYHLHDTRDQPRLLRRTPPVHIDAPPGQGPTADAIATAAEESSYTSQAGAAVSGAGEAFPRHVQDRFTADARDRTRRHRTALRRDQANLDTERRIVAYQREAAHKRIDIRNEVRLIGRLLAQGKPVDNPVLGIRRKLDSDLDRAA